MRHQIERRDLPIQPTAVVRDEVPADRLGSWLASVYQEIAGYLNRIGLEPSGPPFARYQPGAGSVDVEAGLPVPGPVDGEGRVRPSSLPAGPAATTVHVETYETIAEAYHDVQDWMSQHRHVPAGDPWEIYLTGPRSMPDPTRGPTALVVPYQPDSTGC